MERREQYDPEDIERLLQERGYDELLEEERAYVLRHLAGRDEYEAMRALLRQVRDEDRASVHADDEMRDHVMQAFRQEHRPRWQVWLNSVGTLMRSREGAAMPLWRPALAIASVALLVTAGIWAVRNTTGDTADQPLAELKAHPAKAEDATAKEEESRYPSANKDNAYIKVTDQEPSTAQSSAPTPGALKDAAPATETLNATAASGQTSVADVEDQAMLEASKGAGALADETATRVAEKAAKERVGQEAPMRTDRAAAEAPPSHVVTESELMRNYSVANATGKVAVSRKTEEARSTTTTLAESPELLPLMAAGW